MSEGMKGRKKCFSLCRLTDEREVVLGGMRVEGAERGVSEEVWGELSTTLHMFSIKRVHL